MYWAWNTKVIQNVRKSSYFEVKVNVQARTFKTSHYLRQYSVTKAPKFQHEVFNCMLTIILWFCKRKGITEDEGHTFFRELESEAFENRMDLLNYVAGACQRIWTSGKKLSDRWEFCFILNEAIREDDCEVMEKVGMLAHGLNKLCVRKRNSASCLGKTNVEWPQDYRLYRGGGLPDEHQGEDIFMFSA